MALTGLQIQKLLPKTNCKECGSNTCLAFAMKLAAKKASLSECPYASDEAKEVLGALSEPPVKALALGAAKEKKLGAETVLYRHEKTFVSQTLLGVNIDEGLAEAELAGLIKQCKEYVLERVGEVLKLDALAVSQTGQDDAAFAGLCKRVSEESGLVVVARSGRASGLDAAAAALAGKRCLLASAGPESAGSLSEAAKKHGHVLSLSAPDLDGLIEVSGKLREAGFDDLVLEMKTFGLAESFQSSTLARRAALKDNFKPFGLPFLRFVEKSSLMRETVEATNEILKYGGIVVLPRFDAAQLATLFTLRQNIYTDPQKPIQVEPKLYPIGEPGPDSPVFVTTNFSLTYFIVSGEIENSGLSAWLAVPECEGQSVLTAWAAGKFGGATVAEFVKAEVEPKVTSRILIIPGHVAQISGETEEGLPGWKVLVGPREASDLESFIKSRLA